MAMSRTRRLALAALSAGAVTAVSFITGATLIAASIGSPAAAGGKGTGCGFGAGQCVITQTDAFAFWFTGDPITGNQVNIDAVRSTFVMRSRGAPATITPGEICPGFMTPFLADVKALQGPGGGGPPGGGLALPLTVNVTWTGPGAVFRSTSSSTQTCLGFTSDFHTQGASSQANANGNTLGFGDGSTLALGTTLSAGVNDSRTTLTSNGFPGPQCVVS